MSEDLTWLQIEDFVDIFNRVYIIADESRDERFKSKRYKRVHVILAYSTALLTLGADPLSLNTFLYVIHTCTNTNDNNNLLQVHIVVDPWARIQWI